MEIFVITRQNSGVW